MSAAPAPADPTPPAPPVTRAGPVEPPDQAPGDAEGWALLEALRRRLDDQAAQGRKTQLQVGQLAESIGALVDTQRQRSRWANVNSFVAYVLFTLLVGGGFFALYQSRATDLVDARDRAVRERDVAAKRAADAAGQLAARDVAAQRAWELHELLASGKRGEAVAQLATLDQLPLTRVERAVLAARAHETQVMETDAAIKAAEVAFKAGRHGDMIAPLEAALAADPTGARSASMHYYLGLAYAKGEDLSNATTHLQAAIAGDADHDDARFHLASVLDRSGFYARARAEYTKFANANPQSRLAVFALRRSGTLARMPAVAPMAKPSTPVVSAPAPGAPAPATKPTLRPSVAPMLGSPTTPPAPKPAASDAPTPAKPPATTPATPSAATRPATKPASPPVIAPVTTAPGSSGMSAHPATPVE